MSKTLSLELEIFRDALAAVRSGGQVTEIVVGSEIWRRLHTERPRYGYLFQARADEPHRGFLASTPVRPDAGTKGWKVLTASRRAIAPAHKSLH